MSGMASSTSPESFGLVITIMMLAPKNRNRLRRAIEALTPKALFNCVIGGKPGDQFPRARGIIESDIEADQTREEIAPDIGHDAFAKGGDQIIAKRARHRENDDDADQAQEIRVDDPIGAADEAVVDHPADRHRDGERCGGSQPQ